MAGGESTGNVPGNKNSINCSQQLLPKGGGKKVEVLTFSK